MPQKAIRFFLQDVNYKIEGKNKIREWLLKALSLENKNITELSYIICSDSFLLELNKNFLNHNTLTDVITFDMSVNKTSVTGEVYISIDRIKDNAKKYGITMPEELKRVMVHGLLHLVGYNDHTKTEKALMREKEDYYLSLW